MRPTYLPFSGKWFFTTTKEGKKVMLTPRADDPNREVQLKVKATNPDKFGASHEQAIKDKKEAAAKKDKK